MICNYDFNVTSKSMSPADAVALLQVKYSTAVLTDMFQDFGGINWFNPEVAPMELTGDPRIAQSLIIRFKNAENPFNLVQVTDVTYKAGQSCPPQMDVACGGCISTAATWRQKEVRFDKMYQVGAALCKAQEMFTYQTLEERFRDSVEAAQKVFAMQSWNQFVCKAVTAAQAQATLIPTECFATHYIEGGDASTNGYTIMMQAVTYFNAVFAAEHGVFAHRYFEQEMVVPGATIFGFGPYGNLGNDGRPAVNQELVQGGWKPMNVLGGALFGDTVYIAPDNIWFYNPTVNTTTGVITPGTAAGNYNPFLSTDGTKYYVILATRRAFYAGMMPGPQGLISPGTCENNFTESIQSYWYGFNDLLFPAEVMVIAFDIACGDTGETGETA